MKRVAWGVSIFCILITALLLSSCGASTVTITFPGGTAVAIDQGQQVTINVTLTNDGTNQGVTWSCAGAACTALGGVTVTSVTFTANGATGTAVITATSVKDKNISKSVTITVTGLPTTTTTQAQLPVATVGQAYTFTLTVSGGAGTLTWSATGLSDGLSINSSTGAITGTPTTAGSVTFTYKVTDSSAGSTGPQSGTSGNLTITVNPAPILSITKSHAGNFTQGQQGATYTVTVSNGAAPGAGPTVGTTVTVTETVPGGETLVSMAGTGWTCGPGGTTCTRSDVLAPGASYPAITVTVNVAANATTPQTNKASVSGGGSASPPAAQDPTTIVEPMLSINKTHAGNFNVGQQNATYTVTVGNNGSASTSGTVTMTETIPAGETLVSMAGTGWTCGAPNPANVCTRSDALANGSNYPSITVTVNVAANATTPQTNKADVSGGGSVAPPTASDPTTILYPVLGITKSHAGNFNVGQTGATYTVTAGNTGAGAAAPTVGTVTMTETVPAGETLVSMTGTGWTCGAPNPANVCTRSDALGVGSSYPAITVTVNVSASASTPQTNKADVSGGGSASPPTAQDPTTLLYPALNITKSHTGNFTQGEAGAMYTVTVSNNGSAPTVGTVTMTETVPGGETLVSMTGTGWTCGAPNPANVCTRSDTLAVASSYPAITVTVNVAANASTPQTNDVSASGGGATASANGNDPTIIVEPVLTITKSHVGSFTVGQVGATYTVTVGNNGTASTSGTVTVTDTIPSGETLVSMAGTGWTCGAPNPANVCTRSDALATSSSYPAITVTVNVIASATSPQTNKADVSGGGSVSPPTAQDPTTIIEPTLSITKTHTVNFTQGQTGATYTVTVSNTGTAPTNGTVVEVTDTLPAGETAGTPFMSGTGWTCPGGGGANTCDRSDALANGSSYPTITVTVNVSGTATSPQVNMVSVSGGGAPATASESTTDSTVINQISVTFVSGNFSTIAAGASGVTVTAQVTNDVGSQGVTWTLTAGGNPCAPACGSLSNITTTSVTYTPPATVPASPNNTPTITATSVADTSESKSFNFTINSADPCATAGTGGESLLSGSYAFVLKGFDNEATPEPALVGGVLTFNGSGTISAGTIDMNLNGTAGVASNAVTSGTYKIGTSGSADQQRACMSITTASGTQHYRASINGAGTIGHMIGFDSSGPYVAGTLKKQSSSIPTTLSGNFAFGVSSAQNTAPAVGGGKFAVAGVLDFSSGTNGGTVTGGELDFNDNGSNLDQVTGCTDFSTCGPISVDNTGSFSIPAGAKGRGTLMFTPHSESLVQAVIYVVSSSDILILGNNDQTTDTAFAGEALQQSGSLTLSGNYVGAISRLGSTAGDSRVDLIRGTFSGGNITNFTQYRNDSGTVSVKTGGSGTYTISGTGRMLPNTGGTGPVLYLVSSSEAFLLGQNTAVDSGVFQSQTSTAAPNATYAFGSIDPATSNVSEQDGLATLSSPNVNVTQDSNSLSNPLQAGKTQSQTFSVDGTGFGQVPSGCTPATSGSCQFIFYVITSTSAVGTDFGGSDPAVQPLDH